MHLVREFACAGVAFSRPPSPVLARSVGGCATALKPTPKAGRRGGESTARQCTFADLFSQPERVAVPRGFAKVTVGGAEVSEVVAGF